MIRVLKSLGLYVESVLSKSLCHDSMIRVNCVIIRGKGGKGRQVREYINISRGGGALTFGKGRGVWPQNLKPYP